MSVFELNGRKALVTGGAQGLGEGMAKALAAAGAKVVVADVQEEAGRAVAAALGDGHGFVQLDVTDDANWESAVGQRDQVAGRDDEILGEGAVMPLREEGTLRIEGLVATTACGVGDDRVDQHRAAGLVVPDRVAAEDPRQLVGRVAHAAQCPEGRAC